MRNFIWMASLSFDVSDLPLGEEISGAVSEWQAQRGVDLHVHEWTDARVRPKSKHHSAEHYVFYKRRQPWCRAHRLYVPDQPWTSTY